MIKLFTPGPVQVSPLVQSAATSDTIYHRSNEFKSIYKNLKSNLKKILFTDYEPVILTSSGTGAMEACVINLCKTGEKYLYVNNGRFGLRWGEILRAYNFEADEVSIEKGKPLTINKLKNIELDKYYAIFITHVETSTGTINDIKSIIAFIKTKTNALIVVDAVTSIGAVEFRMDEWKIDAALTASQKGLSSLPGASVVIFNERAIDRMNTENTSRFYFDLRKEYKASKSEFTAWTSSVNIFMALNKAVELIIDKNIINVWEEINKKAEYFRINAQLLNLRLYSETPSDSISALEMPVNIKSQDLIDHLLINHRQLIANGQIDLKDKIIRISHMGDISMNDHENLISNMKLYFDSLI